MELYRQGIEVSHSGGALVQRVPPPHHLQGRDHCGQKLQGLRCGWRKERPSIGAGFLTGKNKIK